MMAPTKRLAINTRSFIEGSPQDIRMTYRSTTLCKQTTDRLLILLDTVHRTGATDMTKTFSASGNVHQAIPRFVMRKVGVACLVGAGAGRQRRLDTAE